MARIHRFTLRAAARVHQGQRVKRGHTITLPVGSPGVAALQADPAWDHTMISAPEPRGRVARAQAEAKAQAAAALDVPRKAQAAFTSLAGRLTASVEDLEAMDPAERAGFAAMVSGNRAHLVRYLTHLGLAALLAPAELPEAVAEAPEAPELPELEDEDLAPAAIEPARAPAPPALTAEDTAAKAQAAEAAKAQAKAAQVEADRAAALQALQAKLLDPGSSTMAHLAKLAKLAGLVVPEPLAKGKDRAALIAGLAELIASPSTPSPAGSTAKVNPEDLG